MAEGKYKPDDSFMRAGDVSTWDYKEEGKGALFFGVFLCREEGVGQNNSNVYKFIRHESDSFDSPIKEVSVWGSTILDSKFNGFEQGEEVIIEYLGEEESEKRKGATYHNFEVFHRRPPMKKVEDN